MRLFLLGATGNSGRRVLRFALDHGHHVTAMRECMSKAGAAVTGGLEVRTEARIFRYPDRYMGEGGSAMWERIMALLDRQEAAS